MAPVSWRRSGPLAQAPWWSAAGHGSRQRAHQSPEGSAAQGRCCLRRSGGWGAAWRARPPAGTPGVATRLRRTNAAPRACCRKHPPAGRLDSFPPASNPRPARAPPHAHLFVRSQQRLIHRHQLPLHPLARLGHRLHVLRQHGVTHLAAEGALIHLHARGRAARYLNGSETSAAACN